MSQDCRVLALSHESPDFISESYDTNHLTDIHLQKRRHRNKEQAESRATAIRKAKQGSQHRQKHTTPRGKGERKRAGNSLPTKSPVEETTHPTRAKHLAQRASKFALCLLFTIPTSGNNNRTGTKQNDSHEGNRDGDNTEKNSAPAEEMTCARRAEADAKSMRKPQEKNGRTGEQKGEQRLPVGGTNRRDRKCSTPPSTAKGEHHTAVEAGDWAQRAPEEHGNHSKNTKSFTTNNREVPYEHAEKINTKKTPKNSPEYPSEETRENRRRGLKSLVNLAQQPNDDPPTAETSVLRVCSASAPEQRQRRSRGKGHLKPCELQKKENTRTISSTRQTRARWTRESSGRRLRHLERHLKMHLQKGRTAT